MDLRVSINEKALFVLLIVIAMVSAIGITLAQPPSLGHPWNQIECVNCIGTGNLADSAVTSDKVNFNYAGSDIKGGNATRADSVPWSGIMDIPPDLADGDDDTLAACGWSGWKGGRSCTGCYTCNPGCIRAYCSGGVVTQMDTAGCCYCNDFCE